MPSEKIMILGGAGYLGWPTSYYLASKGYEVISLDSFHKAKWEAEVGVRPLFGGAHIQRKIDWYNNTCERAYPDNPGDIEFEQCDIVANISLFNRLITEHKPKAIVHYAEQPSAPFSMRSRASAVETQVNNVVGTLNLMYAVAKHSPETHIVKLGTMGEYGTPNIPIEEGWLDVTHKGHTDKVLFPKKPGSIYHLSKVHDSHNLEFAARTWGLRVTDLNQGIVWGLHPGEPAPPMDEDLWPSFHYDAVFGTVLNRFIAQAAIGSPLTVYGQGHQTRAFLHIKDTLRCVELSIETPAHEGEFRVFNQFADVWQIRDLADLLFDADIRNIDNPRTEAQIHMYEPNGSGLRNLGYEPTLLTNDRVQALVETVEDHKGGIDPSVSMPDIRWNDWGRA